MQTQRAVRSRNSKTESREQKNRRIRTFRVENIQAGQPQNRALSAQNVERPHIGHRPHSAAPVAWPLGSWHLRRSPLARLLDAALACRLACPQRGSPTPRWDPALHPAAAARRRPRRPSSPRPRRAPWTRAAGRRSRPGCRAAKGFRARVGRAPDAAGVGFGVGHQPFHLRLDRLAPRCRQLLELLGRVVDGTEHVRHAVLGDHVAGCGSRLLQVGAGTGGDVVLAEDELLGHAAAHADVKVELVLVGKIGHHAQSVAARHDGRLVDWLRSPRVQRYQRVPALVVRGHLEVGGRDDRRPPLSPHPDLVARELEVSHAHTLLLEMGGVQRRLVDKVGQVSPREAGRGARQHLDVHVGVQRHRLRVQVEHLPPAANVRKRHHYIGVEPARPDERPVEGFGEVGGGDDDDAGVLLEPVHLDQQLVQRHLHRLLFLWVAVRSDGVDLVDEDDARRTLLGCREEVAHPLGADADKHLLELGARHVEEGHARLARHRPRQ
eukprot:scaffold10429_cov122-Isochrysis_galbana.AAC.2